MGQEQVNKGHQDDAEETPVEAKNIKDEKLDEEVGDILDEIDDVLEANSEDFVRGFVQRGGE